MLGIYAVEDTKSGEFRGIFLQRSNEAAVRLFTDAILHGEDSMMRRYPEDYQVCRLGEFSELSGLIVGCDHPVVLATAVQIMRRSEIEFAGLPANMPHHPQRVQLDIEEAIANA